jgi:hypothetical protein
MLLELNDEVVQATGLTSDEVVQFRLSESLRRFILRQAGED